MSKRRQGYKSHSVIISGNNYQIPAVDIMEFIHLHEISPLISPLDNIIEIFISENFSFLKMYI